MVFPSATRTASGPESRARLASSRSPSRDKESAPISIAAAEKKTWEAPANGKLEIPLRITRRGEFNANLKLKPLGPGAAEALKEFDVDGKATNATLKLDFAALKLAPGDYVFAVQTQTTGKYRNNPEAAALAEAAAKEADKLAGELAAGGEESRRRLRQSEENCRRGGGICRESRPGKTRRRQGRRRKDSRGREAETELAAAKNSSEKSRGRREAARMPAPPRKRPNHRG